ncbi:hypothetical protein SAMN05443574_102240 [Haloarcula vallismortis]|uniref:DUF7573 domain-containing protein n=2 Tax=Haloarcula vallismortis TaxID=28442 RepID=M0JJN7_HALVA|nr:hypothetical protein [Haloarcula vallismortis]EMA09231.1 hypothetical protein C437_06354 [Haloarcula vallismortis ATCC 29715]SDW27817.1 hypothetical protein SAMN05443574_102240 [Haloarcula vallismortis]
MAEDASLEDFLDAGDESEDEREGDTPAGDDTTEMESDAPDSEASTDAVDPAVTTYAWSSEGAACAECGEVVERRWTQDGQLVCGACKAW